MPEPYLHEVTRRLVAEDTVSHHSSRPVLAWAADRLESHGFRVRLQSWEEGGAEKANLVAWAGPPEPDGLILSGHVDVVPFAEQPGWTRDPLHLEIGDERVYGRGSSDMKAFLGHAMDAARRLDPDRLVRPLVLLFSSDEEIGVRGAGRLAPELAALLEEMPVPRLAWVGEPTSGRAFHAHKGIVAFALRVEGRGGHSSVPEAGVNAVAVAARALAVVGAVQEERRAAAGDAWAEVFPEAPYTTLNVGPIHGGSATNMIPEHCDVAVSYRPLPDEEPLALYEVLRARLAAADLRDPGSGRPGRVTLSAPLVAPPLQAARGTPLERALHEELGAPVGGGAPFCTDGGQLAAVGIDSIVCGPGDLAEAHRPDESLSRRAFEAGTDAVLRVALRLCGGRLRA